MFEGFDWQPILIAAIGLLSLVNGLSVFQNFRTDRADVRVDPVYDDDWMYWTKLDDPARPQVHRYVAIGYLARTNMGRRPTAISDTIMKIRLKNMKMAPSPLYNIPSPDIQIQNASAVKLPVMKPEPDPFDFRPMLQAGEAVGGIHCFMFGMYGTSVWTPKTENGILEGSIEMESGFGKHFKSKVQFRYVEFEALQKLFPTLESFMLNHLDNDSA